MLARLPLVIIATLAVIGCDSGGTPSMEPPPEGRLEVVVTYPDGSQAPAFIGADRIEPFSEDYPPTTFPTYGREAGDGHAMFTVPVDTYNVYVEALDEEPSGFEFEYRLSSRFFEQLVLGEEGARVGGHVGVTHVGGPCSGYPVHGDCASLMSEELHPDTYEPVALAWAFRYDSGIFHVGDDLGLVERVHYDIPLSFTDDLATSARVRVVPVPEGFWDTEYPFETPVEVFDGVEATAVYDVPLDFTDTGSSETGVGCLPLELDPELFFGAEHGFAIVVEGESMRRFDEPGYALISYTWERGGHPEDLPVDCDGTPIPWS